MTRRDRGIVLVAVLLAVTVMSVMVVAVSALVRSGISSQRVEAKVLATRYALLSGLEGAEALILSTPPEDRVFLDATAEIIDIGNGVRLSVSIRDAAGLADINRSDLTLIETLLADKLEPVAAKISPAALPTGASRPRREKTLAWEPRRPMAQRRRCLEGQGRPLFSRPLSSYSR